MAKFIYKLQNILNVKSKIEEQAKNEYAIAKLYLDEEIDKLNSLVARKAIYEEKLRNQVEHVLNIKEINLCSQAIKTLEYHVEEQEHNVKLAENKLERARVKMNEAMIDRKTHEKLKENAFDEFLKELTHEENKETDELVSYKYNNFENSEDV